MVMVYNSSRKSVLLLKMYIATMFCIKIEFSLENLISFHSFLLISVSSSSSMCVCLWQTQSVFSIIPPYGGYQQANSIIVFWFNYYFPNSMYIVGVPLNRIRSFVWLSILQCRFELVAPGSRCSEFELFSSIDIVSALIWWKNNANNY